MLKQNVQYCVNDSQYIDLSNTGASRMSLTLFVRNLIREYAKKDINSGYSLHFSDLPYEDKKIFLLNLLHPSDYEYFSENETRLRAAFDEYESECQSLINKELDNVYHDDMREMSYSLNREYIPFNEMYLERR